MLDRTFTKPRITQTHEGLPYAITKALTMPEVMRAIGQNMADSVTQGSASTQLTSNEYSVLPALERFGHFVERLTITMLYNGLVLRALERIRVVCVVHDYLAGKIVWPALQTEYAQGKRLAVSKDNDKNMNLKGAGEWSKRRDDTDYQEMADVTMRLKHDLSNMTPEELLACMEMHPLPHMTKVGRLQHIDIQNVAFDWCSKLLLLFPLKSIVVNQDRTGYRSTETTRGLSWLAHHFPTLEFITLRNSPATQEQFEKVLLRRHSIDTPAHQQQHSHWHHTKLKALRVPFRFLAPMESSRIMLFDGSGLEVSLGVFYLFRHAGGSLEHLSLINIGSSRDTDYSAVVRHRVAHDWLYIARHVPMLKTLELTVPFVIQMGMWSKIVSLFRKHCPHLTAITFNGAVFPGHLEDVSTTKSAIIDEDLLPFASNGDDSANMHPTTANKDESVEEQEAKASGCKDSENDIRIGSLSVPLCKIFDNITTVSSPRPASVPGWCSVLRRLKLRHCQFITAKGVLAVLENCDRLEALDIRNTRVATMELFASTTATKPFHGDGDNKIQSRFSSTVKPWACTDSLVALGLDFGRYPEPSPLEYYELFGIQEQQILMEKANRLETHQREVETWHGGPFPAKFSTLELLQIRRQLFTLYRLRILAMGGPLMDFKIIARLVDLESPPFEKETIDTAMQQMLQDIKGSGGAEIDSLLEHVPFYQVQVSLMHITIETNRIWKILADWVKQLRTRRKIVGSPNYFGNRIPVFNIYRDELDPAISQLPDNHPRVVDFQDLI
ncbi:hypothetical protein BGW41_008067, partial [Actinomortierella wolfii]